MRIIALSGLLAGCLGDGDKGETGDVGGDADTDSDSDSDTDTDSDGDADALPDLIGDLDTTGCEDWDGTEIPGAATYFYGVYESDGDGGWTGTELWLLYANDTWEELGEGDCQVAWTATAWEADTGACASCDVGMDVLLELNLGATDCPEDLYESEDDGEVSYAVALDDDGTSTWYFAGSGTEFGWGYYNDGAMNFVTEKSCKWF